MSLCTYGEVGFKSGDLFAKGDILLLELRLQGGLGISLIVQGLELLLGDFGLGGGGGGGEGGGGGGGEGGEGDGRRRCGNEVEDLSW